MVVNDSAVEADEIAARCGGRPSSPGPRFERDRECERRSDARFAGCLNVSAHEGDDRCEMASPSPLPPNRRVVEASA